MIWDYTCHISGNKGVIVQREAVILVRELSVGGFRVSEGPDTVKIKFAGM